MKYNTISTFTSKRNSVYLANSYKQLGASPEQVVIKNFGSNIKFFRKELEISQILSEHDISVPKVLTVEENSIIYEYIHGTIMLDLLEQFEQQPNNESILEAFDKICYWLYRCYNALEQHYNCEMILGDAHLRNFIYSFQNVYGIDFECATPGKREKDIAHLAVIIVTYTPMCTTAKYQLAAHICKRCLKLMELDAHLLQQEMSEQLAIISSRRKITLPGEIVSEIWSRVPTTNL